MMETKKETNILQDKHLIKMRAWFYINTVLTVIYLVWRAVYTIPFEYGFISITMGLSLFIVEFLGMFESAIHFNNMKSTQSKTLPKVPYKKFPHVDILIATYNETEELLYKTVNACNYLDYPDKSKVHIYICDDGHRSNIKELADKMGVGYFDREDNKHAKAGNLNHALGQTTSPLIVTFDADMIPNHMFLMKTIPYFVEREIENETLEEKDKKYIGFVQTPQSFYNPDLFQKNLFSEGRIPNEQDFFYRDIQTSRNKSNSVIYGGSNTVLSRRAIKDIGGFYVDSITEDYATGMLMQRKKYICIATSEVLASGLSPTDIKSLLAQRIRWARGVIQTNRKLHIWLNKELTFVQKTNYWASGWYWYSCFKRLIYLLSPILFATLGYMVVKCTLLEAIIFWLPMYISSNISLKLLSNNIRSTKWTAIYETALFPFMMFPVLLETIGIQMKKFEVTNKNAELDENSENSLYLIPFALLVVLSVFGIINCVKMIFISATSGPIIVLFWLIVNLYTLIMAAFFILGRKILRKSDRAIVHEKCTIKFRDRVIVCNTKDISETGLSVILNAPLDIAENILLDFTIENESYVANIRGYIVHVDNIKSMWKYAFKISDFGENYNEYLQLIYDRVPTLPQNLDESTGSFDDFRINVARRKSKQLFENRLRPRINVDIPILGTDGIKYFISDINYQYITVQKNNSNLPKKLNLIIPSDNAVILKCTIIQEKANTHTLYGIDNFTEISENSLSQKSLENWVCTTWKNNISGDVSNDNFSKS